MTAATMLVLASLPIPSSRGCSAAVLRLVRGNA